MMMMHGVRSLKVRGRPGLEGRTTPRRPWTSLAAMVMLAGSLPATAPARDRLPSPRMTSDVAPGLFRGVKFDQNLEAQLPLDVPLRDERGRTVALGTFFGRRPVIVNLVYYECPMLCNEV